MIIKTKIYLSWVVRAAHLIRLIFSILIGISCMIAMPVVAAPTSTTPVITAPTSVMVGNGAVIQVPRAPTFVLWQLDTVGGGQINSYVIQTAKEKKVIVIDGGLSVDANSCGDSRCLRGLLKSLGNHVDMWFISHMHADHASALAEILKNKQGSDTQRVISIDRVYVSSLDDSPYSINPTTTVYGDITNPIHVWNDGAARQAEANWDTHTNDPDTIAFINGLPYVGSGDISGDSDVEFYRNFKKVFNEFPLIPGDGQNLKQLGGLDVGDSMEIDGVTIKIVGAKNPDLLTHKGNLVNDSSIVMKVSDAYKSIMFLGDLGMDGGCKLLNGVVTPDPTVPHRAVCNPGAYDSELLKADYVQMSHHGSWGADQAFYQAVGAANCLWPAPHYLYYDLGCTPSEGSNYLSCPAGTLTSNTVRDWMETICGNNYVMFAEVDRPAGQPSRVDPAPPSSTLLADLVFLSSYGLKRIE